MIISNISSRELFLAACKNQKTYRLPIWLMRQAGRYMKDYRQLKEKYDFLTLCKTPELALQVTLQPIHKFDMDAAILFSDILTPLEPMGINLKFSDDKGPALSVPDSVFNLKTYETMEKLSYVPQTIRLIRQQLPQKAVLGFCGAPFTLATYILDQSHKKSFHAIRIAIAQEPDKLKTMLTTLANQMGQYLATQILAGADAVQMFDSWAGNLPAEIFDQFVLPYQKITMNTMEEIVQKQKPSIIKGKDYFTILFIKNFQHPWDKLRNSNADIISVDENTPLMDVRKKLNYPLQGNLSPYELFKSPDQLKKTIAQLAKSLDQTGHIFNLGHGVLPQTPEKNVAILVDMIRSIEM